MIEGRTFTGGGAARSRSQKAASGAKLNPWGWGGGDRHRFLRPSEIGLGEMFRALSLGLQYGTRAAPKRGRHRKL